MYQDHWHWVLWSSDAGHAQREQNIPCTEDSEQVQSCEDETGGTHNQREKSNGIYLFSLPDQSGFSLQGRRPRRLWREGEHVEKEGLVMEGCQTWKVGCGGMGQERCGEESR